MATYSPNLLGWFYLIIALPMTIISLIWLTVLDLRNNNKYIKHFKLNNNK